MMTPQQRTEIERLAAAQADRLEALDADALHYQPAADLPPDLALRYEAHERDLLLQQLQAVDSRIEGIVTRLRRQNVSWHKISGPLHLTPEGARKRFAHA